MKILRDMMNNGASSSEEFELMQQLAETCEKLRPQLFKFAADAEGFMFSFLYAFYSS